MPTTDKKPTDAVVSTAAPAPVLSPIQRTIVPGTDPAEKFLSTFKPPQSAAQIAEQKRQQSQGLISSINKNYDDELARQRELGQGRVNANNAVSVMAGLTGSTEAVRTDNNVKAANDKELQAVNNQRTMALQQVYSNISEAASKEAREQLQDATRSAESIVARRKNSQTEAVNNLKLMASSGLVDFDAFKSSPQNAHVFKYALDSVGGSEDALRGLFMLNRPKDQVIGQPIRVGNKYMQQYQNPITGKASFESIALPFDLPTEYSSFQKMGDNLVAIPDGWDGDVTKLRTVYGAPSTEDRLRNEGLRLDNEKKRAELSGGGSTDVNNIDYGSLSLPAAIKDDLITMKTVKDQANQLLGTKTDAGFAGTGAIVGGTVGNMAAAFGLSPSSSIQQRNIVGSIKGTIAKLRGGTSFTPNEEKLLNQYTPTINDSDSVLEQKLKDLIGFVDTKTRNTLEVSGVKVTAPSGGDLRSKVTSQGYNYDAMKSDGYTDAQIKSELGL